VQPLAGDRRAVRTPALTFVAPNGALDLGKRAVMRGCELGARPAALLRVALHPQDLERHGLVGYVLQRIRGLLEHRRLTTYEEWMAERGEEESRAETRGRREGRERGGSHVRAEFTAYGSGPPFDGALRGGTGWGPTG
jgi:hypothetical protein